MREKYKLQASRNLNFNLVFFIIHIEHACLYICCLRDIDLTFVFIISVACNVGDPGLKAYSKLC